MIRTRRRFEILWESRFGDWTSDLAAIFSRVPDGPSSVSPLRSWRNAPALKLAGSFATSLLLHLAAFSLLSQLRVAARPEPSRVVEASDNAPIYLDLRALKELKILRALPVVRPRGDGGAPGISGHAPGPVFQASTVAHPKLTMVVNPLKPDNVRQAIHQASSPPDLKISVEQQLPDIVLADDEPAAPKSQVDMQIHRPLAPQPLTNRTDAVAPAIPSNAPELPMKIAADVSQPKIPVSYLTADSLHAPRPAATAAEYAGTSANPPPSAPSGLVVLSTQPAAFSQLSTLAQGNRYGALAIAPSKEGPGSPGGKPGGVPTAGTTGNGPGGDSSIGVGPSTSGGGGGTEGVERATLSAVGGSGRTGGVDANGLLSPALPAAIYPVDLAPKLRRPPLVISAGPNGGGGLDVYGALACGKVYSIFLPMPGKNWALQYCEHASGAPTSPEPAKAGVVRMEAGIVPPSPEQQFDFHRVPVPDSDSDKLIILRGRITQDGSVNGVTVFRGVLAAMDAAAAQAFGNWKFKPATRAGAPIDVDVLVGIPARPPNKTSEAASERQQSQAN